MIEIFRKVRTLLEAEERRELAVLVTMIVVMAMIEVVGVASVMPFMAVVSNPEVIQSNTWLNRAYTEFNFTSPNNFLFALGMVVLTLLIFSNSFALTTLWFQARFVERRGYTLARRLLIKYVSEPYVFFLNRNVSELVKNILTEVRRVIGGVLLPGVRVLSGSMVSTAILCLLLYIDPGLAATVALTLGSIYSIIYTFVRKKLTQIGAGEIEVNTHTFKIVNEAMSGIKDLKVLGREKYFVDYYSKHASVGANYCAMSQVISMMPKFSLEIVAFGGILVIILYLLQVRQSINDVIPLISLYAFASYRLMPAVQQIFGSLAYIRYHTPSLELVHRDYLGFSAARADVVMTPLKGDRIPLQDRIELRAIEFAYPEMEKSVLSDLSIAIKARSTVGFVGKTGCGKTTTIDILMGLLFPRGGKFLVDGVEITAANARNWQASIGYVPQTIFLTDDTITRNIAFGVPDDAIDHAAVKRAAETANMAEFIEKELPNKYETIVGDRGIRLSGGQRQRLGIARALYHDPEVLIFDEATSSLDSQTEELVNRAIHDVAGKKTVVVIAHRLSTVRECDTIYYMENGTIAAKGTFEELSRTSDGFKALAAAGK